MTVGKLGDLLVARGVIDAEKLNAALSDQRAFGGKLGRTLVDLGYVTEQQLVDALAQQLDLDTVDLDSVEIEVEALSILPVDACERYGVFPIKVDARARVLWVATAEPDRQTLGEVAGIAQHTLEPVLATLSSIDRAVRRYYFGEKMGRKHRLGEPLTSIPADEPATSRAAAPARPPPAPARKPAAPVPMHAPSAPPPAAPPPPLAAPLPEPLDDDVPEAMVEVEPEPLASIPPGEARTDFDELRTLVLRIEKNVTAQARAFRALVDLLQEKGVVRRGELGARTSKK